MRKFVVLVVGSAVTALSVAACSAGEERSVTPVSAPTPAAAPSQTPGPAPAVTDDDRDEDGGRAEEPRGATKVTYGEAKRIALARTGGGTVVDSDQSDDDGAYEFEIRKKNREYEVDVDAATGKILAFESDDVDD